MINLNSVISVDYILISDSETWLTEERDECFPLQRILFFPLPFPALAAGLSHHRYTSDTLILPLHSQSHGASQLSLIIIIFFYSSLFHLSSFLLLYFCLSPGWLKWVSRRLCCVVFDSSLGAKLSLTQLLGPTVFLKSVSINIIMACSRHHWIFYCNVQQNITPTLSATQKVLLSDRNFLFWLKGLWEVCFIRRSFCVFVVFSFLCFRKSARPPFDKATEGILFLVRHLLLTLSRNRPRCATRSLCRIWLCTCHLRKIMLFSLAG